MLAKNLKAPVTKMITPIARALLALHISANAITVLGTTASVAVSILLVSNGHFVSAAILNAFFVLFDLLDGTIARMSSGGTKFGAVLDSTLDRVADATLLISLAIYLQKDNDVLVTIVILNLLAGFLIPYIRAKAESLSIVCSGGLLERTERLVIILAAIALDGLGVEYALAVGMWVFLLLSWFTVFQRIKIVIQAP